MNDHLQFDALFDNLSSQEDFDKWIEGKQSVYEEKMVRSTMAKFGLQGWYSTLEQEAKDWGGDAALITFTQFHDRWPGFPVRLCANQNVASHKLAIADLFKRFTSTIMYQKFMEAGENIPDTEQRGAWGLIFPFVGMGHAILHNSKFVPSGTRFVKSIGDKYLYLDQFNAFVDSIMKVWKP